MLAMSASKVSFISALRLSLHELEVCTDRYGTGVHMYYAHNVWLYTVFMACHNLV